MKTYVKFLISISSLFFCMVMFAANSHKPLDSIAAVVNNTIITNSEVEKSIDMLKKQANATHTSIPPEDKLRKQVLDQLINRKLQMELAARAGVQVDDAMIDKAVTAIAKQNNINVAELYQKTKEQGLSKSEYRKELHDEILIQQIEQQQVGAKIAVSKQEVEDFIRSAAWKSYNTKEYHLEDILIALPEVPSPQDIIEAKRHAESVIEKINQGMTFQQAAMSESSSTQALQGGDLGWRKLPEIPPNFSDQLVHLKVNGIMGPILTNNGFHIVKLAGIRSTLPKDAASQHKQIEQLIFQRKFEEALQSWITKLRSESFINTKIA